MKKDEEKEGGFEFLVVGRGGVGEKRRVESGWVVKEDKEEEEKEEDVVVGEERKEGGEERKEEELDEEEEEKKKKRRRRTRRRRTRRKITIGFTTSTAFSAFILCISPPSIPPIFSS
jgi:uncharacterized membrane protein YdbT with pleckstrin-like domain